VRVTGLSASRLKWVALVQRATRAWLLRSQTCYLLERGFNLTYRACRWRRSTQVICSIRRAVPAACLDAWKSKTNAPDGRDTSRKFATT
jgi:hypothetical protein